MTRLGAAHRVFLQKMHIDAGEPLRYSLDID